MTTSPTLQSVVETAASATSASAAWIIAPAGEGFRLLAGVGLADPSAIGAEVAAEGSFAAYVLATTQPVALQPRSDDEQAGLARSLTGSVVRALVSVPCAGEDDLTGALELIRGDGQPPFDFDDVEIVTMLGQVAGAAVSEHQTTPPAASPEELGRLLGDLAAADPTRYRHVAETIASLLSVR